MICRVQENEGANTVDLKANLRGASLLQLRLLDRDHVIRLLLTPCGICHLNLALLFLCPFLLHLFFFPSLPALSTIPPPIPPSLPLPTIWCSRHTTRQTGRDRDRGHNGDRPAYMYFRAKSAGCRSEYESRL